MYPAYVYIIIKNEYISKAVLFSLVVFSLDTSRIHSCVSTTHSNSSQAAKLLFFACFATGQAVKFRLVLFCFFMDQKISIALFASSLMSPNDY